MLVLLDGDLVGMLFFFFMIHKIKEGTAAGPDSKYIQTGTKDFHGIKAVCVGVVGLIRDQERSDVKVFKVDALESVKLFRGRCQ